jgi:MFS family permease
LSIGMMAIGSGLIAVTPGYATIGIWAPISLILARLLQGFAVGGEVGPATMFILEAAPKGRRMLFASWQLASQNLGSVASGIIGVLLALTLSKASYSEWGWRVPFAIGILIAPVGVYIRSQLVETLHPPTRGESRNAAAILSTVLRSNWFGVLLGLGLISGGTITQYFLITMTPYAIRTLHLPASTAMLGAMTLGVTGCLGSLIGGALADRWGIKAVAIAPRVVFMLALFPVMRILIADPGALTLVMAIAILSLLHAMSVAVGVILIPLIFPTAVRSTGLAITYALGVAIFGGTATYIVTWLVGVTGDPLASTYYVMAANVVMLASVLAIRRTDYDAAAWPPPADRGV